MRSLTNHGTTQIKNAHELHAQFDEFDDGQHNEKEETEEKIGPK